MTDVSWTEPALFMQFEGSLWSASQVRRAASAHLSHLDEQGDSIRLVISELVTDAVRRTGQGGIFALWAAVADRAVRIEVSDSHDVSNVGDAALLSSPLAMNIVEQLADRWGVQQLRNGRRIWAEFETSDGRLDP